VRLGRRPGSLRTSRCVLGSRSASGGSNVSNTWRAPGRMATEFTGTVGRRKEKAAERDDRFVQMATERVAVTARQR
jgi:hypothetical protein